MTSAGTTASGISIVIPTWNGLSLLQRFLHSVIAAARQHAEKECCHVEIIIVDDGSGDGTVEWLLARGFSQSGSGDEKLSLKLARNEANLGFGPACNWGIGCAKYDLVLLLNNDVEIEPGSIQMLARNFADPALFAAHCRVFDLRDDFECGSGKLGEFARGFIRVHRSYTTRIDGLRSPRTSPLYSMFAGGGSSMYDRKKLISIGGFDDIYAPFYWEDVELSYRAWKRGYSIVYEPAAVARHQISSTIGKLDQHSVRRIQHRNRLVYHWVHVQDRRLLASHIAWVLVLALTAPFRLKPGFLLSLWDALSLLPKILKRRKEERLAALRTDKQVFSVFRTLAQEANIRVYDRREQLQNQINGRDRDAVSQD